MFDEVRLLLLDRCNAATSCGTQHRRQLPPALSRYPFALGVASSDPAPDGVALWTRLLLTDPGQAQTSYGVRLELRDLLNRM